MKRKFEDYLVGKNNETDGAAYDLLCLLASKYGLYDEDNPPIEWDMEIIGQLEDYAEKLLSEKGIEPCRPFLEGEDETPCYLGEDCKRKDCIFRKETENG